MLPRTDDLVVYDSLRGNHIPTREERSVMRRWFESVVPGMPIRPAEQVKGALSAFRTGTEALGVGAVLGAIHTETENGLDKGIAIDGAAGGLLTIGSALFPNTEVTADARSIGGNCLTVWAFRKTGDLLVEKRIAAGKAVPRHLNPVNRAEGRETATVSGDRIVDAAKNL